MIDHAFVVHLAFSLRERNDGSQLLLHDRAFARPRYMSRVGAPPPAASFVQAEELKKPRSSWPNIVHPHRTSESSPGYCWPVPEVRRLTPDQQSTAS